MKKIVLISMLALVGGIFTAEAQILKKLGKTAERAAERTVNRRVATETSKKTDQVLDSILEPGKKGRQGYPGDGGSSTGSSGDPDSKNSRGSKGNSEMSGTNPSIQVYSKFDFVPGDKQIFFDDFGNEFVGDFPSKWNTNGTGEVVTVGDGSAKWFEMKSGHNVFYIPDVSNLPNDYTIEFDLLATGLDRQTASTTVLKIILSDNNGFKLGNYAYAQMSFCQYAAIGLWVRNDRQGIMSEIGADIREAVLNQPHISIAVNDQRFRLWVNEKKVIDVPRLIAEDQRPNSIKFQTLYFKDGKERLFIKNLKVAQGGLDLRRELIAKGKISTNGILFDSGSANLQPQSMGIIRQISQVLQQEQGMNLKIIGHTDSDGNDSSNRDLSKRRAQAVKNALVSIYNIDGGRLKTDGKGEADPVADNNTPEGKAQNRRVEFIKI